MKRGIILILVVYVAIAVGLFMLIPDQNKEVIILSSERVYAQIIDDSEEQVELFLYLSQKDSFLSDASQVIDSRITGSEAELELDIHHFEDKELMVEFQNTEYHLFSFSFSVANYDGSGLELSFYPAILTLTYQNDVTVSLNIGEMTLLFQTIDHNPHFDFFRLYGLYGGFEGNPVMQGIAIGFDGFTGGDLIVEKIRIGSSRVEVAAGLAQMIQGDEENMVLYDLLGGTFDPITDTLNQNASSLMPLPSVLYALPFTYLNEIIDLWRFPLIIDYQYLGVQYQSYIDDFMFQSLDFNLEDSNHVHQYTHRY